MRRLTILTILGLLLGILWPKVSEANRPNQRPAFDRALAEQVYMDNCARCHGATGKGDGRDAERMFPKPRPLSEGIFKFRSTASGTPPTDEDLFRTITHGLPGSRMPDFQRLPEDIRWQLVEYVKSLAPIFQTDQPKPIDLGTDPGPKHARLEHGKQLYTQLGCNACHGALGRGDGPSAPTLVDQWGQPILAADLTQGWNYRAGSSPRDILTRLMTGLDGTPMPSYMDAISPEDGWDLAYYVHSLQEKPNWARRIKAIRVADQLPTTADDPIWQKAPKADLRLSSLFYRDGKVVPSRVNAISVQALYNEEALALRLTWHDRKENRQTPADALALAWLPNWQMKWKVGSLRIWPAQAEGVPFELMRWSAQTDGIEPMREGVSAKSSYLDGQWILLIKRPLAKTDSGTVQLGLGQEVPFGIMVWDGENGEEGRHRSNSQWVALVFEH
jgi:DMSO reductase family type II enzyme heme b subunit